MARQECDFCVLCGTLRLCEHREFEWKGSRKVAKYRQARKGRIVSTIISRPQLREPGPTHSWTMATRRTAPRQQLPGEFPLFPSESMVWCGPIVPKEFRLRSAQRRDESFPLFLLPV